MGTLDKLQAAAVKAQQQLADATAAHHAELQAATARNDERRAAYWSDATDRMPAHTDAQQAARAAVVDALAAGDTVAALAAYGDYVRRHAEAAGFHQVARNGTATYVYTEDVKADPDARAGLREDRQGYTTPTMRRVTRRVPAHVWHRDHDEPPPDGYKLEHPAGLTASTYPDPDPFTSLLAEGTALLHQQHKAAHQAELQAPLAAQLEDEH